MRITGPVNFKVKELHCTLFKTRTGEPNEKLYLSIKESEIKEPLLVTQIRRKYQIVDGFQRYTIARRLGWKEVPVIILEGVDEKELQEIALLRNTLQKSLAPIEKALYIKKLKNNYGYKNVQLATLLGIQKSYISELLIIFKLGDWAIGKLAKKHHFTVAHARILARCPKLLQEKNQLKLKGLIKTIRSERWSIKRLRYELRNLDYLQEENPYFINVDGLFARMNQALNQKPSRFTRTVEIHFDHLWELRRKLTEVSRLLSHFTEFLPEEVNEPDEPDEPDERFQRNKRTHGRNGFNGINGRTEGTVPTE